MSLGQVAALVCALALCVLVGFLAVPLVKLGGVLDELRQAVKDANDNSMPILQELKGTVTETNNEIAKLALVTEDASRASRHIAIATENVAQVSSLFSAAVGQPLAKIAQLGRSAKRLLQR